MQDSGGFCPRRNTTRVAWNGNERTAKSERKVKGFQSYQARGTEGQSWGHKGMGMVSSDAPLNHKVYNFK